MRRLVNMVGSMLLSGALASCGATNNGAGDTTPDPDPTGDGLTIQDIQNGESAKFPGLDSEVKLVGVVVTALVPQKPDDDRQHFYIGQPDGGEFSGIYVYDKNGVTPAELKVGDEITIEALYTEFNEQSQLVLSKDLGSVTVTASGMTVPVTNLPSAEMGSVATKGAKAENYESVLLQIDGTVHVAQAVYSTYGEFTISNGTDELIVDDYLWLDAEQGRFADQELKNARGILSFAFGEFKLVPRGPEDMSAGVLLTSTVYEIQDRLDPKAVPAGNNVLVENVVVTAVEKADGPFWVEMLEADRDTRGAKFSGIYCYRTGATDTVAIGDVLTVEGTYLEYPSTQPDALSQIKVSSVTKTGTGVVPPAEVVTAADIATGASLAESYEGVLVQVKGVFVTVQNPDSAAGKDYGEFGVTGGLRIDDMIYKDAELLRTETHALDLVGVHHYAFGHHKLEPRAQADVYVAP